MSSKPYSKLMVRNEISVLRNLHGMLEHDPVETRDQFCDLMKAAFDLGKLQPRALSDDLGYNISAVYRWIDGSSAPHKSLWPTVVAWIFRAIEQRIEECEHSEISADANAADA